MICFICPSLSSGNKAMLDELPSKSTSVVLSPQQPSPSQTAKCPSLLHQVFLTSVPNWLDQTNASGAPSVVSSKVARELLRALAMAGVIGGEELVDFGGILEPVRVHVADLRAPGHVVREEPAQGESHLDFLSRLERDRRRQGPRAPTRAMPVRAGQTAVEIGPDFLQHGFHGSVRTARVSRLEVGDDAVQQGIAAKPGEPVLELAARRRVDLGVAQAEFLGRVRRGSRYWATGRSWRSPGGDPATSRSRGGSPNRISRATRIAGRSR